MTKQLLLGAHLKTSDGFGLTFARAKAIGANVVQIFLKSNKSWAMPVHDAAKLADYKNASVTNHIKSVVAHAGYLINLAAADEGVLQKSITSLAEELKCAEQFGISYLVVHPGSCAATEVGIKRISESINKALAQVPKAGCTLLLENMAGQGSTLGKTFEELAEIVTGVHHLDRIGFCLDTSHLFAMGYDFTSEKKLDAMLAEFDKIGGLNKLKVVHVNDTKETFGAHKDRHETIGKGNIGLANLRRIVHHPKLQEKIFILETPVDDTPNGYQVHAQEIADLL